jgi:halimadienyl-diphosphate synthase
MDLTAEASALVANLSQRMGPSPYDVAWLARLRSPDGGGLRWPELIDWLLERQHPDGSWGGEIVYYHERIIVTLTVAIALHENGHAQNPQVRQAVQRAERYLWQHLHLLPRDPLELVGFELILPTLLGEARSLGLDVPLHACGYEEVQTTKLRLIPPDMLYSPSVTTVHSLEFLGRSGDSERLSQALAPNGSLGNSPATTAYYLLHRPDDKRAWAYLEAVQRHLGYAIYLYPFATFERAWVLNNLAFCRKPVSCFARHQEWEQLRAGLGPEGTGLDPTFAIPDGDTTSVVCRLLIGAGYDVDPLTLQHFEDRRTHTFRTYNYERNVSVGTNVHALEALELMPDYPDRQQVQEQVVLMLLDNRRFNVYWIDKWHASPYYATAHVLVALLRQGPYLAKAIHGTVDWLLHTQRSDGAWGFFDRGTAEETAYVLTALLYVNRFERVDPDILARAADYLARSHATSYHHPELWIGKCLFTPSDVVRSAILGALILYEEDFGRSI